MLLCLVLSSSVLDCVGFSIFFEIGLGITVNSKVGKQGLVTSGLCFTDVSHLNRLLSQLPLVPVVVWINVLLDKVSWSFDALINHQFVLDSSLNCLIHKTKFNLYSRIVTFLKESSRRRKYINSGFFLHCSSTPKMNNSGYFMNSLIACTELNTQFLSLYLYTPNPGSPGISRPLCFTSDHMQKPK